MEPAELEFLRSIVSELKDPLLLITGALIGFMSSVAMWRRQAKKQDRDRRAEYILRGIKLALATGTFGRLLVYSKLEGVAGTLKLPENPVDELMALAALHLNQKTTAIIQHLHNAQNEMFKRSDISAEDALSYLAETERNVNKLIGMLQELAEQNDKT